MILIYDTNEVESLNNIFPKENTPMKTFDQLSPESQQKAKDYFLNLLLTDILEHGLRFDDKLNKDDLQDRIDTAIEKMEEMHTPWFENSYIMETCGDDLRAMADCDAMTALYADAGETVVPYGFDKHLGRDLDRFKAENEQLRAALKPFAEVAAMADADVPDDAIACALLGDFRRAAELTRYRQTTRRRTRSSRRATSYATWPRWEPSRETSNPGPA